MYSRLLDETTLGAVIAAGPRVGMPMHVLAREVTEILTLKMTKFPADLPGMNYDGTYCTLSLVHLTEDLRKKLNDLTMTEKRIGMVVGEMGLQKARHSDGYYVIFNQKQIDILRQALGEKEDGHGAAN